MADGHLRCAIYTRKSSEEGLDQAFNSLDAQREACAAYIASQRHQGWQLVETAYDDGGISGGTMARPALQRLLADVEARRVDVVVASWSASAATSSAGLTCSRRAGRTGFAARPAAMIAPGRTRRA